VLSGMRGLVQLQWVLAVRDAELGDLDGRPPPLVACATIARGLSSKTQLHESDGRSAPHT